MPKRVLIVEDDADIRQGLNIRLQASGYETLLAIDGVSATAAVKNEQPDLILLDLGLPAGDGFVVLERIREMAEHQDTPVIVVSGRDAERNEQRALEDGALTFFSKPVDIDELLLAIQLALSASP